MGWYSSSSEYKSYGTTVGELPSNLTVESACRIIETYNRSKRRHKGMNYGVPIAPNTLLRVEEDRYGDKVAVVRYWYTDVAKVWEDGTIAVDNGGHDRSSATSQRMSTIGWHNVHNHRGSSYVNTSRIDSAKCEAILSMFREHHSQKYLRIPYEMGRRIHTSGDVIFHGGISLDQLLAGAWVVNTAKCSQAFPDGTPMRMVNMVDFSHGCPPPGGDFDARSSETDIRWVRAKVVSAEYFYPTLYERTGHRMDSFEASVADYADAMKVLDPFDEVDEMLYRVLHKMMNMRHGGVSVEV